MLLPEVHSQIPLIKKIGPAGISEDESETEEVLGKTVRKYTVLELPWRSKSLEALYCYILLRRSSTTSAVGRNRIPSGSAPRERTRSGRVHPNPVVPPGLPVNCYSSQFINSLKESNREFELERLKPTTEWPFPVRLLRSLSN